MPADCLSLPPITLLSNNDLPPSLFSSIPCPLVPSPSLLSDARATHHTVLPAPPSGAGPTLPVTDTPSKATQACRGFSSSDLFDLAHMALDLDVFSAKHGEKWKKWNELGAKLCLRGMNHSDASFQKKLEDLILWQDDPAHATQSTRTLLKGSTEITIAVLLDRLSEAKIEAAACTDEEHDRAVKKQHKDQAGREVICLTVMQASYFRIDTVQETARASPSFPVHAGSAAAVKCEAGPVMLTTPMPRVKLEPVELSSGVKAVKHEPLEGNIGGKAIKHEPLELSQSRLSNVKTEALDSDIEFIGAAHGTGDIIELDLDGEC
ncbi:hypothetical protein EWM64_g7923 [Hericium alpestre]|uniref:Uncharacterized protein n=1 Tax=Hericium alpestre TaxID=135208 RepID=A0A4Y9ZRI1_9AGAM|nr:hypothetical protein EWM64_g7923 [Hericium alpestre]